jgi:hypothetical protein
MADKAAVANRRQEGPLIASVALTSTALGMVEANPLVSAVPMATLFAYGLFTEISKKKVDQNESHRLFSSTDYVVPVLVPVFLFWSYAIRALDGQVFTHDVFGVIACLISGTMSLLYIRHGCNSPRRTGAAVVLIAASGAVMFQSVRHIAWNYERQKAFNESWNQRVDPTSVKAHRNSGGFSED